MAEELGDYQTLREKVAEDNDVKINLEDNAEKNDDDVKKDQSKVETEVKQIKENEDKSLIKDVNEITRSKDDKGLEDVKTENNPFKNFEEKNNNLTLSTQLSTDRLITKDFQDSPLPSVKSLSNEEIREKESKISRLNTVLCFGILQAIFGLLMISFGVLVIINEANLSQVSKNDLNFLLDESKTN